MTAAHDALHRYFDFRDFRPGQEEAVRAALDDRDVLVVMPTGAGKSLCYQLPALMRDDLTIVVSPLVSLMQDQVDSLRARVGDAVGLINAQQDAAENRAVLDRAVRGELRLLYVAPERFSSPGFLEVVRQATVGLFVVDEAHCVSQWGHDFRPDYFRLADAARWLGAKSIVASTATATPEVARDIVVRLGLREPALVSTGFDRPNLSFAVVPCGSDADRRARIGAALADPAARPAIVYAGTRRATGELSELLAEELGVEVLAYHAGLSRDARAKAQRRFMTGEVEVVVATNAFGMGVDKADVRTVCHDAVPGSVEAWYQEAGRAGRDGAPARALLFSCAKDKGLHVFFIERAAVEDQTIDRVAGAILGSSVDGRYDLDAAALSSGEDRDGEQVRGVVGHLARAGVLQPAPSSLDRVRGRVLADYDGRARARAIASAAEGQRARWRQYWTVWSFVEGRECRREAVLRHFGDPDPPRADVPCCDVCDPSLVPANPLRKARAAAAAAGGAAFSGELDDAIRYVAENARPAVGRHRVADILRGSRSKAVLRSAYDGLPVYATFDHLSKDAVLERVDAMLESGVLESSGGPYPVLSAAPVAEAA
jgi:ATP-dependent DNA helicase RecQ